MSKSPTTVGTNTTTSTNAPPQYVQDAQQALLATGAYLNAPFLQSQPTSAIAGTTPDQQQAYDFARYLAQQAATTPAAQVSDYGNYTMTPASSSAASMTPATATAAQLGPAAMTQAERAQAALSQAAQLAGGDISNFFNPYQTDVVNTTTQQLSDANNRALAAIRARQAAESAYGGNRGALQESEQNRNFGNTLASTVAGLEQSGWNDAANLGMSNVQLRQQTGLANQSAQNQIALANQAAGNQANLANQNAANQFAQLQAQLSQQANMANAGYQQGASQFNAGNQQQTNLANAAAQQQAGLFNAQQPLNVAQAQTGLNQASWQNQLQALQALLGTGNAQQQLAQSALNVPFTALSNLAQLVPSQYGTSSTSSQPIYGASTAQTLASLIPLATAGISAFSDKTMKKDLEKMGTDPRTNLDIYKYRFKGTPPGSPKQMGPMAQQVEKKYPGSTERIGGKMAIKGNARQILGI